MNVAQDTTLYLTNPVFWVLAIAGVLLTGISKSGFAGGAGVVAVPLLSLIIPIPMAVALMLPLLIIMDAKSVHYYWQSVDWHEFKLIAPAALIGIIIGGYLLGELSNNVLQLILGIFCIVFALWKRLTSILGGLPYAGVIWGAVSGFTSTLLHSGGPPINIYLATKKLSKRNWIATAAIFFAMMNVIKIIPYSLTNQWNDSLLLANIILIPISLTGVWLGYRLHFKISEAHFMIACKSLLFISGILMIVK